ncbi:MAG: hypothetical protein OXT70_01010 [Chloroflexota bacterium]|nr:hypothetical protein [Chloroflexota bacterium]
MPKGTAETNSVMLSVSMSREMRDLVQDFGKDLLGGTSEAVRRCIRAAMSGQPVDRLP